jgi:hypothetical protein
MFYGGFLNGLSPYPSTTIIPASSSITSPMTAAARVLR